MRAPEVGMGEIVVRRIAEHPLDIVADEGRREIARGGEAVDHGRRAVEHEIEARPRRALGLLRRLPRGDVAPGADDLGRVPLVVTQQILVVADPDIGAVPLAETILGDVAALLEQLGLLGLHRREVLGMDMRAPEIGMLQVFLRAVAEQPLDVLADESGRVVVLRLKAVDHRRRGLQQGVEPPACRVLALLGRLARADVAPRADHLERRAALVANEVLLVIDPAIGAILAAEAIFERLLTRIEQIGHLGVDALDVIGMDVLVPEPGIAEIFFRRVAEQHPNIVADEGRGEIVAGLEAVDDGGRGGEQARGACLRRRVRFGVPRAGGRFDRLLDDGLHRHRVGVRPQQRRERSHRRLGGVLRCAHDLAPSQIRFMRPREAR